MITRPLDAFNTKRNYTFVGKLGSIRNEVKQGLSQLGQILPGTAELTTAFDNQLVIILLYQGTDSSADLINQAVYVDIFRKCFHLAGFNLG